MPRKKIKKKEVSKIESGHTIEKNEQDQRLFCFVAKNNKIDKLHEQGQEKEKETQNSSVSNQNRDITTYP